ncbi:UNVERIFIED_CONTAM: hypothetical protein Slati_1975000 [Sesamum latifolium]|uniref:TOD1/MUCI70 glycosyltransferase-like domain-containing protein n=1 Tax=Sesamum latifolium TaxID=2727402 RepID=A0AAW2WLV6_9LAMI
MVKSNGQGCNFLYAASSHLSSSVSLSSICSPLSSWPFTPLYPPPNAFSVSDHLHSAQFRVLSTLIPRLMENTSMPFLPLVPHAIPLFTSQVTEKTMHSNYGAVLEEIKQLCENSTAFGAQSALRYMQGSAESFGGNLSFQKRESYFDHREDGTEIPCGFLRRFPISDSDRISMEKCDGVVVASAIFNDHDKVRQPRGLGSNP